MLIGANSPTQGYTTRGQRAAEIFGPQIMLWMPSAAPENAAQYPNCVHILRCANWIGGGDPDVYAQSIRAFVEPWLAVPNLVLQLGNEPDIEAGHNGTDFARYVAAVKRLWPAVKVGNPPLSVEKSTLADYTDADVRLVHTYFERQHPESMGDPQFGRSYLHALSGSGVVPVYVTEFNVVQTNCPIDWPDRNKQAAAWIDQADGDGVAGVCLFILDNGDAWSSFDIGPEAAADILADLARIVPAPVPPTPVPVSPPLDYSGNSRPKNGVTTVHPNWYAVAPTPLVNAYQTLAPVIGYDPNLALGQWANETGWGTSEAYLLRRNMAGIGITAANVLGPVWDDDEQGAMAHLALLNCYFGDGNDPWGQLARYGFGGFAHGGQVLNDLNGAWAVPGTHYGDLIAANANQVSGGTAPLPSPVVPTPQPVPAPVVTLVPLSKIDAVATAHIGKVITDEGVPEFGMCEQEFEEWCEESGLPRTRYASAAADGDVLLQRGVLHTTMPPPVGAGLIFGRSFDPNGHICEASDWPYVITTYPGAVAKIDAKANGWYDAPGLLGWFVPEGAVIDGEEEEAIDMQIDGHYDDGRIGRLWNGPKTAAQIKKAGGFDGTRGIDQRWLNEYKAGRPLGFAVSGEEKVATGGVIRYFSNGFINYYPDGTTSVN